MPIFIEELSIYTTQQSGAASPSAAEKFGGPRTLSGARLGSAKKQWQTWGHKAPSFRWATSGWVCYNVDSYVLHV